MQATYVAANEFTVATDRIAEFVAGRRIKADCGGDGIKYCTTQSSSYSNPNTTIITKESELTSNLESVLYGIVKSRITGSLPDHQHNILEGSGGIFSEYPTKDMYQSLLRNSIYLNVTWDGFIEETLIDTGSTTMDFDPLDEEYDFTAGEILQSNNLYDTQSGLNPVEECMISIDYTSSGTLTISGTADGSNWEACTNNVIHNFTDTGIDLRIKCTASDVGSVHSWAVLYNPDPQSLIESVGVSDVIYGPSWDALTTIAPSKNAVYDKIETIVGLQESLTQLLYPSVKGGYNDIYRGGWRPFWFNQQWGGSFGGERPYGHDSEHVWFETGYIEDCAVTSRTVGEDAATTWEAQAFKVSQAVTVEAVWFKMRKTGNPQKNTEPLDVHIASSLDNGAGTTIIANGTANAINGHDMSTVENWPITGNTDGEWYRFTFTSNPSLSANTTYYLVAKATGSDGANHFRLKLMDTGGNNYPHGNRWEGNDADPTTWAEDTSDAFCFLIEAISATQLLQSGGQFDGLLKFIEGNPLDQSHLLTREMKDFWDDQEFTFRIVTEGTLTISKPVLDAMWGFDHDRIVLYVDGSDHLVLKVYESDGTVHTVTGSTDVVAAGVKDLWVHVRSKNDGSDVVEMTLNGTVEGTPVTTASILFDDDMVELGHVHLGGGFPIAPTWDDDQDMSALPSAGIYGYVDEGGAHEAASFSVQNGRLYQNWPTTNTFTSKYDTGDALAFDNAVGWVVTWKCRIERCVNTSGERGAEVLIYDGTKLVDITMHEYYIETLNLATNFKYQVDLTDKEHVLVAMGKGSDFYLFLDGKLIVDGTGLMTTGDANNRIIFGDFDVTANSNGEVVWDYVKYYDGGELFPDVNAFSLSEFAYWSGDKGDLETVLYNGGSPYSVKEYCGIKENYVKEIGWTNTIRPITLEATTTSSSYVLIDDMEAFVLSSQRLKSCLNCTINITVVDRNAQIAIFVDGSNEDHSYPGAQFSNGSGAGAQAASATISTRRNDKLFTGLHKVEGKFKVSGGATLQGTHYRKLIVREEK